jgi:hypothetical protein
MDDRDCAGALVISLQRCDAQAKDTTNENVYDASCRVRSNSHWL